MFREKRKHMIKIDYIFWQQQKVLEAMEQEKEKIPLSIRERAELEELRRMKQDIEKEDPDMVDRLRQKDNEMRRKKEVARKKEERRQSH